jgi:hypothetical protein
MSKTETPSHQRAHDVLYRWMLYDCRNDTQVAEGHAAALLEELEKAGLTVVDAPATGKEAITIEPLELSECDSQWLLYAKGHLPQTTLVEDLHRIMCWRCDLTYDTAHTGDIILVLCDLLEKIYCHDLGPRRLLPRAAWFELVRDALYPKIFCPPEQTGEDRVLEKIIGLFSIVRIVDNAGPLVELKPVDRELYDRMFEAKGAYEKKRKETPDK